jgi:hypothetical protein
VALVGRRGKAVGRRERMNEDTTISVAWISARRFEAHSTHLRKWRQSDPKAVAAATAVRAAGLHYRVAFVFGEYPDPGVVTLTLCPTALLVYRLAGGPVLSVRGWRGRP